MKYFILIALVACALTITSKQSVVTATTAADSHKETAIATFKTPVKLMDVLLQGEYMFVHDDQAMAVGDGGRRGR